MPFQKGHKSWLGKHRSSETKEKIRLAMLGNKHHLGMKHSFETIEKIRLTREFGQNHRSWKGDKVGKRALHLWVRRWLPKPEACSQCNKNKPLELTNVSPIYNSETYNRDFKNWQWLCHLCHMQNDGRIKNLNWKGGKRKQL